MPHSLKAIEKLTNGWDLCPRRCDMLITIQQGHSLNSISGFILINYSFSQFKLLIIALNSVCN